MAEYIDLNTFAENYPSLCIPRAFKNITENTVRNVFNELKLGKISTIDVIQKTSERGEEYKRIFIHFEKWYTNPDAQLTRKKIITGKEIKIVYNDPWFWKVSASRFEPRINPKPKPNPKPVINEVLLADNDAPPGVIIEPDYDAPNVLKNVKKHKYLLQRIELEEGEIFE